ncbi:MAG: GGDEF domain-containing response regulator, partial [Archangium sp.]
WTHCRGHEMEILLPVERHAPGRPAGVEVELPGEAGLAVLQHLHPSGTPVLLLTREEDASKRAANFTFGADDVLPTSVHPVELLARVQRRLEQSRRLRTAERETARMHALAVTDGLTGVANFRFFQERLREEFRRAQRYDTPLALVMLDLDHFKTINDTHGHQVGDEVLIAAAQAVQHAVRETDIVARYGGEEFAMLLPQTHLAGALTVAERVAGGLQQLKLSAPGVRVTGSFGLSGFPSRGVSSPEHLVRTADLALYRAKNEGRNKISLFQSSLAQVNVEGHSHPD